MGVSVSWMTTLVDTACRRVMLYTTGQGTPQEDGMTAIDPDSIRVRLRGVLIPFDLRKIEGGFEITAEIATDISDVMDELCEDVAAQARADSEA